MPRRARTRTLIPETTYHILARGNNRQTIFHAPPDYETYRRFLHELLAETPALRCYHYCLMPNHVHLLLYAEYPQALVTSLQRLQLTYAWYHRRTYRTSGHLWQGRYKSLPIMTDPYLLEAGRYIERNPLEAKLASPLESYPWTSYPHTAFGRPDPLLTPSPAYLALGPTLEIRQSAWGQYLLQQRLYLQPSPEQLVSTFHGG